MKKINPNEAGLALGGVMGLWHAVWSAMVFLGIAKPFYDFILGLHFISLSFKILAFNLMTALTLVVVTAIIGYLVGFVFAIVWNSVRRS